MAKVKVSEIHNKMVRALESIGYTKEDIDFLVDMYLGGEMRGHTSHGLANFSGFVKKGLVKTSSPEIIIETNSLFMVDVASETGNLHGRRLADKAIEMASKEAMATVIVKNMGSWMRPGAIAQYIADKDYVAIVLNDGGGTSIAPPGGYDPMLGTNPIAYGIPTNDEPLVVDIATSKKAWGQVRLANKYGTDLPKDTFYNDKGKLTLDPKEAYSVLPFGEHKGFSLALLVEVLCGSMVGMEMMIDSTSGNNFGGKLPDRGGVIMVIDPRRTTDLAVFKNKNTEMLNRINNSQNVEGQEIRIPGEKAGKLQKDRTEKDEIEITDEVWEEIRSL